MKAAVSSASLVVAQMNRHMPRVPGDGFLHVDEVDYLVHHDEPLLEYLPNVPDEIAARIGKYVARIVQDGDTIQVGYGSVPNAIMAALGRKKHLGLHSELLTDGIVDLIRRGRDRQLAQVDQPRQERRVVRDGPGGDLRVHRRQPRRSSCAPSTTRTARWSSRSTRA